VSSHSECKYFVKQPLPHRVLDVGGPEDTCDPYLCIPDSGQEGNYVALSYCWRKDTDAFVTTTSSNIRNRKAGIPLSSLPTALREAVHLTKRFDSRYLWVDALCIIQGDEVDWVTNAAKMDEVYGNAVLIIAAVSAASCMQGVLSPSLFRHWKLHSQVTPDDEPINHRAWTLQERLLSHRYLSFGTEYMTWQCQTLTRVRHPETEMGDHGIGPFALRTYHFSEISTNPFNLWLRIIIDYTSRHLTKKGDKLPALSSIAKAIHEHTHDQYLAGLWRRDILRLLLWRVDNNILKSIPVYRPEKYRAPSWSWASIEGNISLLWANGGEGSALRAEFIDCTIEPLSTEDPFGKVKSGTLVLRGPLKQASGIR